VGVYACVHLAQSEQSPVQAGRVAEAIGQHPDYLIKILQRLTRDGILSSIRGPSGGFRLARPASDISLLEIVEAIDGRTVSGPESEVTAPHLDKARSSMEMRLGKITRFAQELLSGSSVADLMN
jgi:Rrf2 family protein